MKIIPAEYNAFFEERREGFKPDVYSKKLKEYDSYYLNAEGVDPDTVMYTVYSDPRNTEKNGGLLSGLTILMPVTVNGECAFTKGHFHKDQDCEEIYECLKGQGLLMLMDHDGNTWCEEVKPLSIHHIHGDLAHRLINTGDEPLEVYAVWPVQAGHDYDSIQSHPFGYRVMKHNGKIEVIRNEQL